MEFKNQYLTYEEYKELGGKLIEKPFNLLEFKAEKTVDEITFNRFRKLSKEEYPQELKMCVYDLIDIIHSEGKSNSPVSETVGSYSITRQSAETIKKNKGEIITQYLSGVKVDDVPVLYRGADLNGN